MIVTIKKPSSSHKRNPLDASGKNPLAGRGKNPLAPNGFRLRQAEKFFSAQPLF